MWISREIAAEQILVEQALHRFPAGSRIEHLFVRGPLALDSLDQVGGTHLLLAAIAEFFLGVEDGLEADGVDVLEVVDAGGGGALGQGLVPVLGDELLDALEQDAFFFFIQCIENLLAHIDTKQRWHRNKNIACLYQGREMFQEQ